MVLCCINENVNIDPKRKRVYCWSKILKISDLHRQYRGKVKHELRVQIHELRVQTNKLED